MKKLITRLALLLTISTIFACQDINENVIPLVGTYEGHVMSIAGPFSFNVAYDTGDDLIIEAPFDGIEWLSIYVDIDDEEQDLKFIDIPSQNLGPDIEIWGDGFYFEESIQLEYTIRFGNFEEDYTLIGTKN